MSGNATFTSPARACPHCGGLIQVEQTMALIPAVPKTVRDWRDGLTDRQISAVESARSAGLLDALGAAYEYVRNDRPRSIESYFLTFVPKVKPKALPPFALTRFREEFGTRQIEVRSAEGIAMVLAAGNIRAFVPERLFLGEVIKSRTGQQRGRIEANEAVFDQWVRTRNGYVAGKGLMWEAISGMQPGNFALSGM